MTRIALLLACACLAWSQAAADYANSGYKTPEQRERLAKTLNSHERTETQRPRELVAALQIRPGMTAADIGTGPGFMLPYLAEAVGPAGSVIAEDIFPDFLDKAKASARDLQLSNVRFVLGTDKSPNLPPASVDVALILDAYHHFDYPADMLSAIRAGLKPGGRLAIVEFYQRGFADPKHIRLDEKGVLEEVQKNGFKLLSSKPFQPDRQYIAIFERN